MESKSFCGLFLPHQLPNPHPFLVKQVRLDDSECPGQSVSRSVQSLSCVLFFATPWTAAYQASLSITNSRSLIKLMSIELVMPSNHLILCHPLLLLPSFFPSIGVFSNESALCMGGQCIGVSASTSVLPMNNQDWSLWDRLVGSPCTPSDSQESSPAPQFKSISSSVLSFLYTPNLSSIHDHWKNQSFDSMDLCWESNVSACFWFPLLRLQEHQRFTRLRWVVS